LLSEVLFLDDRPVKVGTHPLHLLSARDKTRPVRKSTRGSPLDEKTMKGSIFSTLTVMPLIQAGTAANNQIIVFHSLKYRGVSMKNKFSIAVSLAVVLAMLLTSLALADQVSNNLDTSVDSSFEVMSLNVGGSNGSTILRIVQTDGDGKPGCNLTGSGRQLTVSAASSNTAVAIVSPSSVTFNNCDDTKTLAVTPGNQGSADITLSFVSVTTSSGGVTSSSFDLLPGRFTVNVAPPPNTAPVVAVTGVTHGASYEFGTVPAAGCSVQDAEDGTPSVSPTLSTISGALAAYGLGTQTATCSYTDSGGLTTTVEATYEIVDTTAPTIAFVNRTPANGNGWNNGDVTVNWSCSDNVGVVSATISQTVSGEAANQSATGTCTDLVGLTSSNTQTGINIDKTAPAIAFVGPSTAPWYNADVTANWSCTDSLSGPESNPVSAGTTGEGIAQSATGTCIDLAGNSSSDSQSFKVDKTAPVVTVTGVANGATYTLGSVPAAGCSTSDALSGVATNATLSISGGPVGSVTATCSGATDVAGNSGSASVTYNVIYNWSGFFQPIDNNGVFNVANAGRTIPVKFSLGGDQGLAILATGYPKITSVACPASAPLDTVEELSTATVSGLRYDALANQYIYNWKTLSTYANKCYQLSVKLIDGTEHTALFKFTR
jgi:hypothetical protein